MNDSSYTNATTCKPLDLEQLKKVIDEFDAKYPKSERCEVIEVDLTYLFALKSACVASAPQAVPFGSPYAMPIIPKFDVPMASWIERMADRSGVAHYPSGLNVRCLP